MGIEKLPAPIIREATAHEYRRAWEVVQEFPARDFDKEQNPEQLLAALKAMTRSLKTVVDNANFIDDPEDEMEEVELLPGEHGVFRNLDDGKYVEIYSTPDYVKVDMFMAPNDEEDELEFLYSLRLPIPNDNAAEDFVLVDYRGGEDEVVMSQLNPDLEDVRHVTQVVQGLLSDLSDEFIAPSGDMPPEGIKIPDGRTVAEEYVDSKSEENGN